MKVPGLYNTQTLNKIFPLVVAITHATSPASHFSVSQGGLVQGNQGMDMFRYFWEELGGYLWNEDSFECLFKLLARRELTDMVPLVFQSKTTKTIFSGMSYQYRLSFIEHLLNIKHDMMDEIQAFSQTNDGNEELEEFLYERRMALSHFFERVYESMSQQPYAL